MLKKKVHIKPESLPGTVPVRPDRVSVTTGQVVNLGNYNSARVETGVETDVQPGEALYDAQVRAFKASEAFLAEAMDQIVEVAMPGLEGQGEASTTLRSALRSTSPRTPRQKSGSERKPLKRLPRR